MKSDEPRGTVDRDTQILAAFNAGRTTTVLAREHGLTRARVWQIIRTFRLAGVEARGRKPVRPQDEVRAANAAYMRKKRQSHPEMFRQRDREYYARHAEAKRRTQNEKRLRCFFQSRAKNLRGEGRADKHDLARLWKAQRGRCALTGTRLDRSAHLDHIIPRVRGGSCRPENLRWLAPQVNHAKRDLTDHEFIEMCRAVLSKSEREHA